jgi:hypothetical protein
MHKKKSSDLVPSSIYALFTYTLPKEDKTKRVKFVYALKGRKGGSGIVSHYKGHFLAPACFVVPWENARDLKEVFTQWNIEFDAVKISIMEDDVNTLTKKN